MEPCEDFGQQSTYLSNYVKKLVCYHNKEGLDESNEELILITGLFNWSTSEQLCIIQESCSKQGTCDYEQAVVKLCHISNIIHQYLIKFTSEQFWEKYEHYLKWTCKSDNLLRCFDLLKSCHPGHLEVSLLVLTSTLEQILGDIYLMCSGAKQCPSLLRDLLQTELKNVLGGNLIFCLEVYIGSPLGLNLRNLIWHGFLSYQELQQRHVSFLLMCALSLCEETRRNLKTEINLQQRSLITYAPTSFLQDLFPKVQTDDLNELFNTSSFVTSTMVNMWELAIELFKQERYGHVVMIMLPQLEHSLRRVYAFCNHLPEKLQTAESSELYTTLNEIFSPVLSDNTPNNFPNTIGPQFMEILQDMLVHQEGPRLRDHISHGEVNTKTFPKHLTDHVFSVCIAFCLNFSTEKEALLETEYYKKISDVIGRYSSIYHPVSCLRRECIAYLNCLTQWKTFPKPSDEDFSFSDAASSTQQISCKLVIGNILRNTIDKSLGICQLTSEKHDSSSSATICEKVLEILSKRKLSTLFRPRHELEVVVLLRNVINQCFQASNQIHETAKSRYAEWKDKKLRSRQRQTYKRFWFNLPFIEETMVLGVVIVVTELIDIESIIGHNDKQIKFLKRCLQFTENLCSLSSRNRWQECSDIGKLFIEHTQTYYEN